MTSDKRWLAMPACIGLAVGLLPTAGYVWAYAAKGAGHDSAVLGALHWTLFSLADPAVFILRSLGFDIYYVEAHGPTRHTFYVWALVCASSLVFWLVVVIGIAAAWSLLKNRQSPPDP